MTRFALTIAASDPSGGAGIEADLKVFAHYRVFGLSAITGITVQGPEGIEKVISTPASDLARILEIILAKMKPKAVKIGALISGEQIKVVKRFLEKSRACAVLDPVLKSGSGFPLLEKKAWPQLFSLFPLVDLITPNLPEAEALSGVRIKDKNDMMLGIKRLAQKGAKGILLKGGHGEGPPEDIFWRGRKTRTFRKKRLSGRFHGSGCALASAAASGLALGLSLEKAVERAESYIDAALESSVEICGVKYLTHIFK